MAVDNIADMAFQYTLAYQSLQSSLRSAENATNTNQAKSEALKSFQDTLTGLLPEDVVSSPQYEYYSAMTDYQADLYAASTAAERDTALSQFYAAIKEITVGE
ncbi:hypothetical protein [Desulfolutivibrio sulfoxidireducens]|uniref:hypothetical protein n=1 Tax=Desulfolutivibrio sulfoxidireducens TaxID=2773299 RepID=UPI00159EA81A|nr:hypothetical protein [Desulfolutivibrio sulfoxidireducens]QLA15302.1 hypothetical protein GD605_03680 [Desulfolutivibrio sulfoxidireducens]QLA18878.1 hypothetical protein GD604_03595 [Desulfolutivibrio sulfoxidireducens]